MPTVRLRTEAPSLTCPSDKTQVYYTDLETQRLRLRVARSGRHVWDWRCAGRTEVLGVYDTTGASGLTYQEAKAKANRLNAALDRGHSVEAAIATPPQVQTVGEMMDYYLEHKVRDTTRVRREKGTYRGTQSAIKPLLARHDGTCVPDMNREMLLRVVRDAGLAGLVAGVKLVKIYRAAWNYCQRSDVLAKLDRDGAPLKNPASNFVLDERELRVKFRGTYATSLSDEQIVALLRGIARGKAAWDGGRRARAGIDEIPMRWPLGYLAIEFLIHTGCRKMEAETLHVADIVGDVARIIEHKTDHTGRTKDIHLSRSAHRVLAEAARLREEIRYTGPLVFPGQSGGQITAIADCLDTACQIAGIRRLIPHNLRSIYINFAVRSGTPIEIVSKNVGHENLLTTRRHYEAVEREIRAQHAHAASAAIDRLLAEADQQAA